MTKHPYHIVDPRPWPLTGAIGALFLLGGLRSIIHKFENLLKRIGLVIILCTIAQW